MEHASETEVTDAGKHVRSLSNALQQVLFGQEELIQLVLTGILARGHILLEGLPGLGKTELVKGLSRILQLETRRVQFTPDLLPGDITGNPVLQEKDGKRQFVFQPGPLFTNIVLADEINRASPKTQSALLEAMQERRVTVLGESHQLPSPFFVLATQNPIELEGTYPLPEAQLDRFLFKLEITRNDVGTLERIVNDRDLGSEPDVNPIMEASTFIDVLALVRRIYLPDVVANYIARLVDATHPGQSESAGKIKFGASPRAALSLAAAAKARALMNERTHASFEDVKFIAPAVLRHRIILDYNARVEGLTSNEIISLLLEEIPFQAGKNPRTLQQSASS
jgi:MoxR-like ATPase